MRVVNGMKDDGLAVEDIGKAALAPVDIIRESSEEKRKGEYIPKDQMRVNNLCKGSK